MKRIRPIVAAGQPGDPEGGQLPDRDGSQDQAPEQGGDLQAARQPGIQGGQAEGPPGGPGRVGRRDPSHRGASSLRTQREAYHKIIGAPFDLAKLNGGMLGQQERMSDMQTVDQAFGGGGGQRADPNFNTKVARPAYAAGPRHPRVLFDEAHHNFHTASGPLQALRRARSPATATRSSPTAKVHPRGPARRATSWSSPMRCRPRNGRRIPAFTDAECDAVRDWVRGGGSLLLITDHAPFGSAAEGLAKRFGVDLSKGAVADPDHSEEGDDQPGLQPAEPPAGRPPDHAGPRRLRAGQQGARPSPAPRSRAPRGASRSSSWPRPRSRTRSTTTRRSRRPAGPRAWPSPSARGGSSSWARPPSSRPRSTAWMRRWA